MLYATRKTTRFLRATISLGKWLLIISAAVVFAFIAIWSMYEAWEREDNARVERQREKMNKDMRQETTELSKSAIWEVAKIKDQNKEVRDCVILPTRCQTVKSGKITVKEAK